VDVSCDRPETGMGDDFVKPLMKLLAGSKTSTVGHN
jgi:hypothetical protein